MKWAMARQAEAERKKRAKIINAAGESLAAAALGDASDVMMAHPLALQLRNLQSLVEIGADKNSTVVFPAPLMSTIAELGIVLGPLGGRLDSDAGAFSIGIPGGPGHAPASGRLQRHGPHEVLRAQRAVTDGGRLRQFG